MTLNTLTLLAASAAILTGCATALQTRSAPQIAQQAFQAPDAFTGLSQTQLPEVPAFKRSSKLSGTAQLLTAEAFEGQTGGAWMDVSLFYDTPSEAADQMRLYKEQLNWAGGEPVKLADFAASVVSCEDRVTQYNRGGYYGRSGFGHGGYDSYGYRGVNSFGHNYRQQHPRSTRNSSGNRDSIGDALRSVVTDVSEAHGSTASGPTVRPAPRVTSRSTPRSTPRVTSSSPTSNTRNTRSASRSTPRAAPSRPTARPAPRVSRTAKHNRRNVKLEFQNADLANKAAGQQTSAHAGRIRLAAVSPFERRFNRGYNYGNYGGYGLPASDYVITSACGRQERLRIFVPQSRLAAAERYGLVLFARAKSGDAQTLTLSPNYVTAFQMARGGPG